MAMASLGAGEGDESFLPCGKHGSCLCARIVMLRVWEEGCSWGMGEMA